MTGIPPTVLVIDDDPIMRRLMMAVLDKSGYTVRTSSSVAEGLELIAQQTPDIILCDMALPEMSGLDFLRHCRANPDLAKIPVIIVSSVSDEFKVREALELGAAAHISKPFSQAQLLQAVADILGSKP
jgi:CheY-like chemotaxis protein